MEPKKQGGEKENSISLDQLLTKRDLLRFKEELLEEIAKLLKPTEVNPNKQWLKSVEVRKMLQISPGTLQTLRINGTLPFTRLGGSIYYKLNDIKAVLEKK